MPAIENRDPNLPEFWDERFEKNIMPWDSGGIPSALKNFVTTAPAPLVTLIPGCGIGHEVGYLSDAGWDVIAIDFSPAAVAAAQRFLGPRAKLVLQADFFTFMPPKPLQLIYERAFLCALPPDRRQQIAARWAELLPVGGLLAGYFYFNGVPGGPPFAIEAGELDTLLGGDFERLDDQEVVDSIDIFAGHERWQVWLRIASAPSPVAGGV